MRLHAFKPQTNPNQQKSPLLDKVKQQEKVRIKAKKRDSQDLSTQMFISEIFAMKNCAKTKEKRRPKKPKKERKKQTPTPPQELFSKACATSMVER
jgi:hypothetical protein